jgi:adenosylhomocysteine nucleosidase
MKRIGIIAAMNEEMQEIKKIMTDIEPKHVFNLTFFKGKINSTDCILVESGVGKVNAARTTQIMMDYFKIEYIINIGTAGAASNMLNVTDVVIADKLCQYDFDVSPIGYKKGEIMDLGLYFYSEKTLLQKCQSIMQDLDKDNSFKVHVGTVASADMFCTDPNIAKSVNDNYGALCVEMEGASIAQVCTLNNTPFIVIRSISDSPNGNNNLDFSEYLSISSKRCASFLKELLD